MAEKHYVEFDCDYCKSYPVKDLITRIYVKWLDILVETLKKILVK